MTGPTPRILLVDDEPELRHALEATLARRGYSVDTESSGEAALGAIARARPDLLILDLGLPGIDGVEVVRRIRQSDLFPIVVLSARQDERDKVEALDLGADDYVTKPFGVDELLARIRVALRHASPGTNVGGCVSAGPIAIDRERHCVTVSGQEVRLTPIEFELLGTLAGRPNRVFTHRVLLQRVWGPEYETEGHYLHVHVANLRRKIEPDPHAPVYLVSEPGVGYRLRVPDG